MKSVPKVYVAKKEKEEKTIVGKIPNNDFIGNFILTYEYKNKSFYLGKVILSSLAPKILQFL